MSIHRIPASLDKKLLPLLLLTGLEVFVNGAERLWIEEKNPSIHLLAVRILEGHRARCSGLDAQCRDVKEFRREGFVTSKRVQSEGDDEASRLLRNLFRK